MYNMQYTWANVPVWECGDLAYSTRVKILLCVLEHGPLPVWEISKRIWPFWVTETGHVNTTSFRIITRSLTTSEKDGLVERYDQRWRIRQAGRDALKIELHLAGVPESVAARFLDGLIQGRHVQPKESHEV